MLTTFARRLLSAVFCQHDPRKMMRERHEDGTYWFVCRCGYEVEALSLASKTVIERTPQL